MKTKQFSIAAEDSAVPHNKFTLMRTMADYFEHPEKVQNLFSDSITNMMAQRGIDELLVVPITFDNLGDNQIKEDEAFLPVLPIEICKATSGYENDGMVMYRLKIIDGQLMFHGGEWHYEMSGDLDLSCLDDESADTPWLPVKDFSNVRGLITIADFLMNNEAAWLFTASHPDSLYSSMVEAEKRSKEIPPRWQRELIEVLAASADISVPEYISTHILKDNNNIDRNA